MSIVVTSAKARVETLALLPPGLDGLPCVVSRAAGLGFARNEGARRAKGKLLVFLDDDLLLNPDIVKVIFDVKQGEFAMTFLGGFPCTRVMVIYAADFWRVGGFDESIRFTGEDRDFYVRALEAGLKCRKIPIDLVYHRPHKVRAKNIHVALASVRENMVFLLKYGVKYPKVFRVDFWERLKRGQARTLLLEVFWLYYLVISRSWRKIK